MGTIDSRPEEARSAVSKELLDEIGALARRAGAVIMPYFRSEGLVTRVKSDASKVTAADDAADALIVRELAAMTPGIPIVSEESVEAGHRPVVGVDPFWLVDPLDGTKEFIRQVPEFTVNIALIEGGRPVLGAVFLPASGVLYGGATGMGAFVEEPGTPRRAIAARPIPAHGITVTLSRTYGSGVQLRHFLEHYVVARQIEAGSSLKFCLIAGGEADVYPRYGGSMEWDTAAGHAVLRAAGGSVREIDGGPELGYGKPGFRNPYFIAWGRSGGP